MPVRPSWRTHCCCSPGFGEQKREPLTATSWTWNPSSWVYTITFSTPLADQWNIAAAAGFAAYRNDGGAHRPDLPVVYPRVPDTHRTVLVRPADDRPRCALGAYMCRAADCTEAPANNEYLIAHQMGHLVSIFAAGARADVNTDAALDGACDGGPGHHIHSKEHQSSAVYEGIAHLWAAMAFNNTASGADCGFDYYLGVDWNYYGTADNDRFDCDGTLFTRTIPTALTIDGTDYLGDVCGGSLDGRATELDWLRFWWDLVTDASLTDDDVFAIRADATLGGWNAISTGGTADPPNRLRNAAVPYYLTNHEWDSRESTNGVGR